MSFLERRSLCSVPLAGGLHCVPSRSPASTAGTQKLPLFPLLSRRVSGSWSCSQGDGLVAHYVPAIPKGGVGGGAQLNTTSQRVWTLQGRSPARPRDLCCLRERSGSEPHLPSPSSDTTGVGAQNVSEKHIRWLNRRQLLHGSILCVVERIQKLPETHARMDTKF